MHQDDHETVAPSSPVVALGAALAVPVRAQSLLELYDSARGYDAT